jgi:hypothetical protein
MTKAAKVVLKRMKLLRAVIRAQQSSENVTAALQLAMLHLYAARHEPRDRTLHCVRDACGVKQADVMVYQLEQRGWIRMEGDFGKKVYHLTPLGEDMGRKCWAALMGKEIGEV